MKVRVVCGARPQLQNASNGNWPGCQLFCVFIVRQFNVAERFLPLKKKITNYDCLRFFHLYSRHTSVECASCVGNLKGISPRRSNAFNSCRQNDQRYQSTNDIFNDWHRPVGCLQVVASLPHTENPRELEQTTICIFSRQPFSNSEINSKQ